VLEKTALLVPPIAFALSLALVRFLIARAGRGAFLDRPNARSLHSSPVPRIGGLGLMASALLGIVLAGGPPAAAGGALVLMLPSLLDDWRGLPAGLRLALHLCASTAFVRLALPGVSPLVWAALAVGLAWMTNLYNFMDGSDGLAGGMAVIGFGVYALAAALAGHTSLAHACLCVSAAAAGFLVWNFAPARVFLGDSGSIPLGFLAGAIGLYGYREGAWPIWFPLLVFGPFVADASVTLARRALRGERVWQAHRSHYYQRVILLGWRHRRTALSEYALMLASGGVAVLAVHTPFPVARVALIALLAAAYHYCITSVLVDCVGW
jgi:UDP-N-acetylmuramyl pentapeptide phosphotransferase/UDP-N-acetylglucosamine-1-phosphate transferase